MPKLNIDQFDETPNVGDSVKVMGKVQSIDEDSGEVEVSYDQVSIVGEDSGEKMEMKEDGETEDLDSALNRTFSKTQ